MKSFLILFEITLMGLSCFSQNDGKNKSGAYSFGITWKKVDGRSQIICDTTYMNQIDDKVKLQSSRCPFEPYMLVVTGDKLLFLNKDLDLKYQPITDLKIHNAAWSPFNKSEIYLLAKKEFAIEKKELTEYLPDTLFDLILYSLNLESMQINQITTLFDFSVRACRLDADPPEFFSREPFLKIDAVNKLIYYDCLQPWNPDGDPYFLLTYVIDLKKNSTSLLNLKEFKPNNLIGNEVKTYGDGFFKPIEITQKKEFILFKNPVADKPDVKIPTSIFYEEPIKLAAIKEDYEMLAFRIFYSSNSNQIVCSPYKEVDMGTLMGNTYIIDANGKLLKTILKNVVVGYDLDLWGLDNGNYLFGDTYLCRGIPELYLFDKDFKLLQYFSYVKHYEVIKQDTK